MSDRFRSRSEHPKSKLRAYGGPKAPVALRDGKPTKVTTKPGVCERCKSPIAAGDGWLVVLPWRNGRDGSSFAAICRTPCS